MSLTVTFPNFYLLSAKLISQMRSLNQHLRIKKSFDNSLIINGTRTFSVEKHRRVKLELVENFSENWDKIVELEKVNENNCITFELLNLNKTLIVRKGMGGTLSILTAVIMGSLVVWALAKAIGYIYSEDGDFLVEDPKNPGKKIKRKPDISLVKFDKLSEEKQLNLLDGKPVPVAPNVVFEIVSQKNDLDETLEKMVLWMENDVELGIVVDPYSEKIYIFEKNVEHYKEQSIFEPFTHYLLPDYVGDYSSLVQKIKKYKKK